ncbi:saccharopine dehydrogenase family protein [Spongisporangium articulatum]|uniref:Saccharopine dehydrogenase family protein n=1 Tax=Spongisporangium articulatum TaxID=3362603 RepID=A0ABW8AHS8_9ACTN
MTGRIVVFGATGYSGELTAQALVDLGQKPVLAGRSQAKLTQLSDRLGGLETAVADVDHPQSVQALVGPGDVLISLVGPFARWGTPAVEAAVRAGAHYLDSTGEPPFIREVFRTWGPPARTAGVGLVTAMGYDYVPGNLAAGLALADSEGRATSVRVGYFVKGPMRPSGISGGTRASLLGALFEPGFAWRNGRLDDERAGLRAARFSVEGRRRDALSVGMSEHFGVPQAFPQVRDVDTYLGWFGPASRPVSLLSRTGGAVTALPVVRRTTSRVFARLAKGSSGGPDLQQRETYKTLVVAEASDAAGRQVGRAVVQGVNPYDFTGRMLAVAAAHVAEHGFEDVGALGPVAAFGLAGLERLVGEAGLHRSE